MKLIEYSRFRLTAAIALVSFANCLAAESTSAIMQRRYDVTNVADSTQGFVGFGTAPSVNNAGAVAFTGFGVGFLFGAVFKSEHNQMITIASSAGGVLRNIGTSVDINASGTVVYTATLSGASNGNAIIATSDGRKTDVIVNAAAQGLFGRFLSIGGLNNSGKVSFLGTRFGLRSQALFTGNGGPLQTLIDTATSKFTILGNSDIDDAGNIVFRAFLADGTEGLFTGSNGSTVVADTRSGVFAGFLDPVISGSGIVAGAAFLSSGSSLVFTITAGQIVPRNNPANPELLSADNVCINNAGHVAFSGDLPTGGRTIYVETTGRDALVPVIATGDSLFGSTVVNLNLGTHSLNERDQISFQYTLADGRTGIGLASPAHP